MRPTLIFVAGAALSGLLLSGCSTVAFGPAATKTAVAAADAADIAPQDDPALAAEGDAVVALAFAAPSHAAPLDPLIAKYALQYGIPERLMRRIIVRESGYNAAARNGPYYGLMQISHATARGMGYSGQPGGLLDAETNLRYAGKYLSGAYITARGNEDQAVRFYANGYYYDAKRQGLLEVVGLR